MVFYFAPICKPVTLFCALYCLFLPVFLIIKCVLIIVTSGLILLGYFSNTIWNFYNIFKYMYINIILCMYSVNTKYSHKCRLVLSNLFWPHHQLISQVIGCCHLSRQQSCFLTFKYYVALTICSMFLDAFTLIVFFSV